MVRIQESYWAVVFTGLLIILLWQALRLGAFLFQNLLGIRPQDAKASEKSTLQVSPRIRFRTRILSPVLIGTAFISLAALFAPAVAAVGELAKLDDSMDYLALLILLMGGGIFAFAALLHSLRKGDLDWDRD